MGGKSLIDKVISETNLPEELIKEELYSLIRQAGLSPETIKEENLREVLVEYLQEVILQAQKSFGETSL
ncbi:MAG: hypothetical protein D6785_00545 [Planctomycetota bacterium]|nr:MAG: hypothetical protein D6785_00545 [Planctomycetota bacterium]